MTLEVVYMGGSDHMQYTLVQLRSCIYLIRGLILKRHQFQVFSVLSASKTLCFQFLFIIIKFKKLTSSSLKITKCHSDPNLVSCYCRPRAPALIYMVPLCEAPWIIIKRVSNHPYITVVLVSFDLLRLITS